MCSKDGCLKGLLCTELELPDCQCKLAGHLLALCGRFYAANVVRERILHFLFTLKATVPRQKLSSHRGAVDKTLMALRHVDQITPN